MSDLRKLAEAATPGPWAVEEGGERIIAAGGETIVYTVELADRSDVTADAAHIAAWSPDRALAALDVIEAAKGALPDKWNALSRSAILRAALDRWDALP